MRIFLFAAALLTVAGCTQLQSNVAKGCADATALGSVASQIDPKAAVANAVVQAACADAPAVEKVVGDVQAAAKPSK